MDNNRFVVLWRHQDSEQLIKEIVYALTYNHTHNGDVVFFEVVKDDEGDVIQIPVRSFAAGIVTGKQFL